MAFQRSDAHAAAPGPSESARPASASEQQHESLQLLLMDLISSTRGPTSLQPTSLKSTLISRAGSN